MKNILILTCSLLLGSQLVHAQILVGAKAGYNRYFTPGINGGSVSILAEVPQGDYFNASFRGSLFYDLPMKNRDMGTLSANPGTNLPDDYVAIHSTYRNVGLGIEYLYYFVNDAFETGPYCSAKGGLSYSTISRQVDDFNTDNYTLDGYYLKNHSQVSLYLGASVGFQFSLGTNSLLFTEVNFGFPFIHINGEVASTPTSKISGYPQMMVSGSVGFKQSIFN